MRDQRLGALLGSCSSWAVSICWAVLATFPAGSGDICSATMISLFIDVPGGSQVINVMVLGFSWVSRTDVSLGPTIVFL